MVTQARARPALGGHGVVRIVPAGLAIDKANENNGAMQFIDKSHQQGYFDSVQSSRQGNILSDSGDMILTENDRKNIVQTKLDPGQCTFHDGI